MMVVPTKILVATDFSTDSGRALEHALELARLCKAKVSLLHVLDVLGDNTGEEGVLSQAVVEEVEDDRLACATERIQNQLDSFPQAKEVEVDTSIREGIPHEEILKEAQEQRVDMIVIASLGQSGNVQYSIGRVARNVLKGAECPVLLTK